MKKMFFAALAAGCLLAATTTSAQQRPAHGRQPMTAEQMAKHRTERMTEVLKLDEVQKQELYKLNLERAQQMHQMREQHREAAAEKREAAREQMQKQNADYDAKLKKLLSAEQYKQWSEQQQQRRGRGPAMRSGDNGRNGDAPKDADRPRRMRGRR